LVFPSLTNIKSASTEEISADSSAESCAKIMPLKVKARIKITDKYLFITLLL
jgi:hypothetical protein